MEYRFEETVKFILEKFVLSIEINKTIQVKSYMSYLCVYLELCIDILRSKTWQMCIILNAVIHNATSVIQQSWGNNYNKGRIIEWSDNRGTVGYTSTGYE